MKGRLSIGIKLLISPTLMLLFMVAMGGATYVTMTHERDTALTSIESDLNGYERLADIEIRLGMVHARLYRSLSLANANLNQFDGSASIQAALNELREIDASLVEDAGFDRLRKSLEAYVAGVDTTARLLPSDSVAATLALEEAGAQFERVMNDVSTLLVEAIMASEDTLANTRSDINNILAGNMFLAVIAVLVSGIVALWMRHTIRRDIQAIGAAVNQAAQGDLTVAISNGGGDEIGRMAVQFNSFMDTQRQLIGRIDDSSAQVATAAQELAQVTTDTNALTSQQHAATDQVASAIHELATTVQEVASNAQDAASAATEADEHARNGNGMVKQTIDAIEALADDVTNAADVIGRLEQDTASIGSILDVIQSIAEQTNLLALNAAIEAARAGDQGRGFAVVAEEVRTLASRTQSSTEKIQEMIERVQSRSHDAAEVMSRGQNRAKDTVARANMAGQALDGITAAVGTIREMNGQIAFAAEQQSQVTDNISENIVRISETARSSSDKSAQTSDSSEHLKRLAGDLRDLIRHFKIN